MRPFIYQRAADPTAVFQSNTNGSESKLSGNKSTGGETAFLAGGTTLIDLMKLDVMRPGVVIDINDLQSANEWGSIQVSPTAIRLGALARMSQVIANSELQTGYPVLVQSLSFAASHQLRNMASLGGNLLQRTRCTYFRDPSWEACNKRTPGSGCAALEGVNRMHAVLGTSEACIATYPGDFAQALLALDAQLELASASGNRTVAVEDFFRQPGSTPEIETALQPGELVRSIMIDARPWARRSAYVKVRDRQSFAFALASAAIALDMEAGKVRESRIALGGVATIPWRAREAEQALQGQTLDESRAQKAADAAFASANPRGQNAFKVALGKSTLVRALLQTSRMEI